MELAMTGLGKMEANITTRLLHGGHRVVAFDYPSGKCCKDWNE